LWVIVLLHLFSIIARVPHFVTDAPNQIITKTSYKAKHHSYFSLVKVREKKEKKRKRIILAKEIDARCTTYDASFPLTTFKNYKPVNSSMIQKKRKTETEAEMNHSEISAVQHKRKYSVNVK